jgi:hypothetical protein
MSLGQPDLYIDGQLMQTAKGDPRPALAGLRLDWGSGSRVEMDPPAKLSGQLLIRGAMPEFLEVGAPVGLIDPASARTLFAGQLQPLRAVPDEQVRGALRVSFTAASPLAELIKHKVLPVNFDNNTPAATRFNTLATTMPRGWQLTGSTGMTWINQVKQQYAQKEWLILAERFCRSYTYRYHDTSYYTPGAGLSKRITFTPDKHKTMVNIAAVPGTSGTWFTGSGTPPGASGVAVLPTSAVAESITWEKSPEDLITDVQLSTFRGMELDADRDSGEVEYNLAGPPLYIDNSALQDAYGFRQVKIETSLTLYNDNAFAARATDLMNYWLDTKTKWRPEGLQLPDSRKLAAAPLLNLLAVDTRGTAVVSVPAATNLAPGLIRSFVTAGQATWTGKKWITDLTLGRTL